MHVARVETVTSEGSGRSGRLIEVRESVPHSPPPSSIISVPEYQPESSEESVPRIPSHLKTKQVVQDDNSEPRAGPNYQSYHRITTTGGGSPPPPTTSCIEGGDSYPIRPSQVFHSRLIRSRQGFMQVNSRQTCSTLQRSFLTPGVQIQMSQGHQKGILFSRNSSNIPQSPNLSVTPLKVYPNPVPEHQLSPSREDAAA
jgi:hypothetical protein